MQYMPRYSRNKLAGWIAACGLALVHGHALAQTSSLSTSVATVNNAAPDASGNVNTPVPSDGSAPVSAAQAALAAPVKSVNTQVGAVVVPNSIRAFCAITTFDSTGAGSCTFDPTQWTGGSAFSAVPSCSVSWTAGNNNYIYDSPIVANSATAPSVTSALAALKILNITLGATTIWNTPPAGSTLGVVCRGQ